jgi:hypothetical protein
MSIRDTRLRVPALLLAALSTLLVFADVASAETRTGESNTVEVEGSPSQEATLVKASASYETTGGSLSVTATTEAEPTAADFAELKAVFFTAKSGCSWAEAGDSPYAFVRSLYFQTTAQAVVLFSGEEFAATKVLSGTTTTLSTTAAAFADQAYDCVRVMVEDEAGRSFTILPVTVPVVPPALAPTPAPQAPVPQSAAAAKPVPAVLSITRPKALKLKVGKARTVKVKVTNTGGTATTIGSLKVKAPKGVLVKPGKQQIPSLLPSGSSTLSVGVELTEKAKKNSTLSLTGIASGLTVKTSFVVKLRE